MKRKKQLLTLALICAMILLSACGSNSAEDSQISGKPSEVIADNQGANSAGENTENDSQKPGTQTDSEQDSQIPTETDTENAADTQTKPDNSGSQQKPDNSGSQQKPDNSGSQQKPDNSGSQQKPDNSGSQQKPDNSGSQQKPDNSGSQQKPDNSGSQQKPDNSGSQQKPDNSGSQQKPDNSDSQQKPDNSGSQQKPQTPSSSNDVTLQMLQSPTQAEQDTAASIVSSVINASMSEYQKVRAIHDYLVNRITYSFDFDNPAVYTAQGAFNGAAVCQGYTEAFSLLCYKAGIQAEVVTGTANNGGGNGWQGHAWNLVRVDGVWYQVDVTWDDPIGATFSCYDYFLTTDARIGADHRAETYSNQHTCSDDRYFAVMKKETLAQFAASVFPGVTTHYVTNKAEIASAIASESITAGNSFVIMWDDSLASETLSHSDVSTALSNAGVHGYSRSDTWSESSHLSQITIN